MLQLRIIVRYKSDAWRLERRWQSAHKKNTTSKQLVKLFVNSAVRGALAAGKEPNLPASLTDCLLLSMFNCFIFKQTSAIQSHLLNCIGILPGSFLRLLAAPTPSSGASVGVTFSRVRKKPAKGQMSPLSFTQPVIATHPRRALFIFLIQIFKID